MKPYFYVSKITTYAHMCKIITYTSLIPGFAEQTHLSKGKTFVHVQIDQHLFVTHWLHFYKTNLFIQTCPNWIWTDPQHKLHFLQIFYQSNVETKRQKDKKTQRKLVLSADLFHADCRGFTDTEGKAKNAYSVFLVYKYQSHNLRANMDEHIRSNLPFRC